MTSSCAFCALWVRPASHTEIWRDENVAVVLDVAPRAEGQLVVVPVRHGAAGIETAAAGLAAVFELLRRAGHGDGQATAVLRWDDEPGTHAVFVIVPGAEGASRPVARRTASELRHAASFLRVVAQMPMAPGFLPGPSTYDE